MKLSAILNNLNDKAAVRQARARAFAISPCFSRTRSNSLRGKEAEKEKEAKTRDEERRRIHCDKATPRLEKTACNLQAIRESDSRRYVRVCDGARPRTELSLVNPE